MIYIAHTAHWQFFALVLAFLAWIITLATAGQNEWRLWYVDNTTFINSGVAWIGIWRACFYSHVLSEVEYCQDIIITDSFLPVEIPIAQVLIMIAVISGLIGNMVGAVAVRMAYFSLENRSKIRLAFLLAGTVNIFTAFSSMTPLLWNMTSVLTNQTIHFPPEYRLPAAPARQRVGNAIGMGIFASILTLISGLLFFCYRYIWQKLRDKTPKDTGDPFQGPWTQTRLAHSSDQTNGGQMGRDNPTFQIEEVL